MFSLLFSSKGKGEKRQAQRPSTACHSDHLRKDYASGQLDLLRHFSSHLSFLKLSLSRAIICACVVLLLFHLLTNLRSLPVRVLCRRSRNSVIARRARLSAVLLFNFPFAFLPSGSASFDLTLLGTDHSSEIPGQFASC